MVRPVTFHSLCCLLTAEPAPSPRARRGTGDSGLLGLAIRLPASSSFTDSPWLHRWFFILHSFTKEGEKKKREQNTIFILGEIISTVHLNQTWNRFIYEELFAEWDLCCCGRQNKKKKTATEDECRHTFCHRRRYRRNAIKWAWTGSVFKSGNRAWWS